MSLAWLFPAGFAALSALLLPLLLHLARRDQQGPLDFAALRWLRAQPRPRRRLRFDERLLLALRLLLLALLALWLARPALHGADVRTPYVAVMPGVGAGVVASQELPADARGHWLARGFPLLEAPAPTTTQPTSSLLRQLDAELPAGAPLIVLATARFDGADAQPVRLSRKVDWRVVDGAPPRSATPDDVAPPRLRVRADSAHAPALRYLRAAERAWPAGTAAGPPVEVWLQAGPLPADLQRRVASGTTVLLPVDATLPDGVALRALWRDDAGEPLAEGGALGRGRLLRFTRALQPQAMPELLEPTFPRHLRELLQPARGEPARADAHAHAPLTGARAFALPPRELQPWLALAIALLFALERMVATRARRWVPA